MDMNFSNNLFMSFASMLINKTGLKLYYLTMQLSSLETKLSSQVGH